MAARIIKGGGEVPERPLAVPVRAPQVSQDKKIVDRDTYNARQKAEEILREGQALTEARQARGQEEAEAARARARDEQSHTSRQEAVTAILRAYRTRGDRIAAMRLECLEVCNGLVAKITGQPLSVPRQTSLGHVDKALRNRRGKFPATIALPAADLETLRRHGPLVKALEATPELKLDAGDGVLKVSGGEVPLDMAMAARGLCAVLGVPLPPGVDEEASAEDNGAEESAPEADHAAAMSDDDLFPEVGSHDDEEADESAEDDGAVAEAEDFADEAFADTDSPAAASRMRDDDEHEVEDEDEADLEGATANRPSVERSIVTQKGNAQLLPPIAPANTGVRRVHAEGTRVESPLSAGPGGSRVVRIPTDERSGAMRLPPRSNPGAGDERNTGVRATQPPPRPHDFDEEGASTVAVNREDVAALQAATRRTPGSSSAPKPPPVDGTRVDVRQPPNPAPAAPRTDSSGLNRRPR